MFSRIVVTLIALLAAACSSGDAPLSKAVKVEVVRTSDGYALYRDGEPYPIRGAGMGIADFERFAGHGGNSIRNWTTRDGKVNIQSLLDEAHANGVTVALCLPMKPERHGFDYDDEAAVAAQFEAMREDVLRFRDHPALLFWIIGNELNHSYTNPRVFDAVDDVARMIKELDPAHPVTTALSGFHEDVITEVERRATHLDFISLQLYGNLFGLPEKMAAYGFDRPFMVTEWGTIGYWEMENTGWGAPVELTSSEKADVIRRAYTEVLQPLEGQLIGSHVFLWGQKQERTPTWFGLLTKAGDETESVDVMHEIWRGEPPANRTPRVTTMLLDGKTSRESVTLAAGERYEASIELVDPDGDPLSFYWELKRESGATQGGGDFEAAIDNIDGLLSPTDAATTALVVSEPGKYRLFAYAYDGQGHTAHANIPFLVEGDFVQSSEHLVSGEHFAISYSGFREGQHPDRGNGAVNPSRKQILEDLRILVAHGFRLIRMYDSGRNTRETLELIREHDLPIDVLLGIWLDAEFSNHERCEWLTEPISPEKLAANALKNADELTRGIALANEFEDIVVAVNVGNEALVEWNDHMVPLETVIAYVRRVKSSIRQPVTVADNYDWWRRHGAPLAAEVDFLGVHTYPQWEGRTVEQALAYSIENIDSVRAAHPGKPIAVLEAGWATVASEFGARASEEQQLRHIEELRDWAKRTNVTVFWFEAFDEPWKGDPANPLGAEKHWGLFDVNRNPKLAMRNNAP